MTLTFLSLEYLHLMDKDQSQKRLLLLPTHAQRETLRGGYYNGDIRDRHQGQEKAKVVVFVDILPAKEQNIQRISKHSFCARVMV